MYCTGIFLHWRIVAWIAFIGAIVPVFMTAFWTPESPLWLIHNGRDNKALESLKYLKNYKHVIVIQQICCNIFMFTVYIIQIIKILL